MKLVEAETGSGFPVGEVKEKTKLQTLTMVKRPPLYKVIMLNDDYTPMDFVVMVLRNVFHKAHEDAVRIMLDIHHKGAGLCGSFTREVAETKIDQVTMLARQNEYPLKCILEME